MLDPTLLGLVDVTEGLQEDGTLIVNTTETPAQVRGRLKLKGGKVYTVNASHIAIDELGREITNTPMLGALCAATGMFDVETVIEQIEKDFGKKMRKDVVEANVRAVRRAAPGSAGRLTRRPPTQLYIIRLALTTLKEDSIRCRRELAGGTSLGAASS